jgi:hypothetical protein
MHHLQRHPHQQLQDHVESQVFYPATDHIHPSIHSFIHSINTVYQEAGDLEVNKTLSVHLKGLQSGERKENVARLFGNNDPSS